MRYAPTILNQPVVEGLWISIMILNFFVYRWNKNQEYQEHIKYAREKGIKPDNIIDMKIE